MSQIVNIVSGGRIGDRDFFRKKISRMENVLIICCDGGVRHLQQTGIKPDVIIGDMDSIDSDQLESYSRQDVKIIKYPASKDFTDTELALDYAINLKPAVIYIWAALGGRLDHTLSNLFLLEKTKALPIKAYLIDEYCEVFLLSSDVTINESAGQTVSLIALSPQVEGIALRGFLYPLDDAILRMGESRAVSNIINDDEAKISVRSGCLLVIRYWQKDIFPEAL
ncbi:MAG: thiamine diphosphokinase [Deltaproteobacteria bacterium]